jgi:hypothetical protein
MKKLALILILFIAIVIGCDKPGITEMKLTGVEQQLPDELKGLKVYTVSIGGGEYVKVAILNGEINSATYQEGKTTSTTIIINKGEYNEKTIYCKEILAETKDIIVIKK